MALSGGCIRDLLQRSEGQGAEVLGKLKRVHRALEGSTGVIVIVKPDGRAVAFVDSAKYPDEDAEEAAVAATWRKVLSQ